MIETSDLFVPDLMALTNANKQRVVHFNLRRFVSTGWKMTWPAFKPIWPVVVGPCLCPLATARVNSGEPA